MSTAVLAAAAMDACLGLISRRKSPHPVPNACPEGWGQAESQGARQPHIPNQRESLPSLPAPALAEEESHWGMDGVPGTCASHGDRAVLSPASSLAGTRLHGAVTIDGFNFKGGGSPKVSQPDLAPETHLSLLPTPSHPRAFAQTVMGSFHQVPAVRPWTGHSLLSLRSLLVI